MQTKISKKQTEIADIIKLFGADFINKHNPNSFTIKVLNDLASCRTSILGGHEEKCDCCGKKRYSYNSCKNRHCPKCQSTKQAEWIDNLTQNTLPVKHYHVVFTLPH